MRSGAGSVASSVSTSSHVRTVSPLIATIRSPWRNWAKASPPLGSSDAQTVSTCVVLVRLAPTVAASPVYTTNARTTFIVTPAARTTARAQIGWRSNARAGSTGTLDLPPSRSPDIPSSSIPAIFT